MRSRSTPSNAGRAGVAETMEYVLARVTARRARRGLPAPQVLVRARGVEVSAGDRTRRFVAASVGKWMTATLALQLAEQGRLALDATLPSLLPRADWQGLFTVDGRDRAGEVTVEHLLTHTSGAADYFDGPVVDGRPFPDLVTRYPDRFWTPVDLLEFSRTRQHPVGTPGQRFSYSDTGFVLLGRVIEEAAAASLGAQLHARVLGPAGMADSCLLFHTAPGTGAASSGLPAKHDDMAPLWIGRTELSGTRGLSSDWGGGGVVSTLDDLLRFADAWTSGSLLSETSRLHMQSFAHRLRPGVHYGAGLIQLRYEGFFPLLRGLPYTVGHLGVTGVHLFVAPDHDIAIAMNFHSTREMTRSFRTHIRLMQAATRGRP